jgi:demethylmenaquinone methyltransferase / 2-methoxy-6-polyprenyl-1,4-benzoquinol methylase
MAVRHLAIKPGSVVADFMCGTGNNLGFVLKAGAGQYIGLDAMTEMMKKGAHDPGRVTYLQADLTTALSHPPAADHVLCTYGIKCLDVSHYNAFSQVINQVLKPGGTVSILEFRLPSNLIFRFFANLYVSVFCGLVCLLLKGRWPPTKDLYRSMTPDIYPEHLATLLRQQGFVIALQEKPLGSAVLVYGVKLRAPSL